MKKIYSFILAAVLVANLNAQTTYTFSNCGATGQFGPTQGQATSAYTSTTLAGLVTINTQGIQEWTVPSTATYRIEARGAQGGGTNQYGKGAKIVGDVALTAGSVIKIVVGQSGGYTTSGSGGGGSFVCSSNNSAIVIAGGGGGQYDGGSQLYEADGRNTNNGGNSGCANGGSAGAGGSGCNNSGAAGGGGLTGNGGSGSYGNGGASFTNSCVGGTSCCYNNCNGGFGGGGSTHGNTGGGGGGGGYSGGAGGFHNPPYNAGGGGGYFNSGSNQTNTAGFNTGMGAVVISQLCVVPVITVSASLATVCVGSPTTLTASGGTTYAWMPGNLTGASVVVSPTATTTYTVTGSSSGCSATATVTITVNTGSLLSTTATLSNVCPAGNTTLTAAGATSYTWMPGNLIGASVTVAPLATTTYTVTGINSFGCSSTTTRTITVYALPVITASSTSPAVCSGSFVAVTGGGGTSYSWTGGVFNAVPFAPTSTQTYTVTGTDLNGCSNTASTTISVNPLPTVSASSSTQSVCPGGSAILTGSGASTYYWSPVNVSAQSVTVNPATTTTYTVTGTNANGCTNTATVTVSVTPLPTISTSPSNSSICIGSSATITASGASTYSWMPGNLIGSTVTVSPVTPTTYTVTGTSSAGCVNSTTTTVLINPVPTIFTTTTASTICANSSTTITASGASTYTWMPGNLTGATVTVSPSSTTTYTVTGTNSLGCSNTATRTITTIAQPSVTANSSSPSVCAGNSVTLTGGGAATYSWSGGVINGISFIPTATTTYTVTGAGSNGCTNTATITLVVNILPVVSASSSSPSVCSGSNVNLAAGGASTYTWMPGNLSGFLVTVAPTATTTYTVTGTNANGCSNTATSTVLVNALPTVSATSSLASVCAGGSVTLTGSGASTYTWMPGNLVGSSVSVAPTSTTTYTVSGVGSNGCSNTAMVMVTVNPSPSVTANSSAASVCTGNSVTLTGGGASTYAWSGGVTNAVAFVPTATMTYTVTGTGSNGCTNTATTTVTVNALPTVTASSSAAAICAGANVTLTGGGASTYAWSGGVTNAVAFMPTATMTYTVTGTNVNGCVNTAMITVTVNPLPVVTANSSPVSVCNGDSLTLTGGGASTYVWDNNVIDGVIFLPAVTTTYMVTGTDSNGCVNTAMTTIGVYGYPTVSASITASVVCSGDSVTLTGGGASTYVWDNNVVNGVPFLSTISTTYLVTGIDSNGCMDTTTIMLTVNSLPSVTGNASSVVVCIDDASVTLTGAPTGGAWSGPGVMGSNFNPATAGLGLQTASYSYTGPNGCVGSASVSVQVDACIGFVENTLENGVSVYPNPNNGSFTLSVNANVGDLTIKITDMQGRVVYTSVENNVNAGFVKQISLDTQSSGMYLMHIITNGEQQTKKISVQK